VRCANTLDRGAAIVAEAIDTRPASEAVLEVDEPT
jgi:hypothetical protein